jgi:hypothetical protein
VNVLNLIITLKGSCGRHMPGSSKSQVIAKINFLERQLTSLDHYLPDTFEYLMEQLDVQRRTLAEIDLLETYEQIESEHDCPELNSRQSRC